jgi:hypothetical protein
MVVMKVIARLKMSHRARSGGAKAILNLAKELLVTLFIFLK